MATHLLGWVSDTLVRISWRPPKPYIFGMATHLLGWVSESWGAADASATEGAGVSEGGDGPADRVALPLDRSADDESLHRPAPIAEKRTIVSS
jgi:hypothetical protein